jgi:hypothetical protein
VRICVSWVDIVRGAPAGSVAPISGDPEGSPIIRRLLEGLPGIAGRHQLAIDTLLTI